MLEHEALAFSFDVDGKIWKMALDEANANLALELRHEESFDVSYLVFNINSLEISNYMQFEEADWWGSLVEINENLLLIDKYKDPQNPIDKALLLFDWTKEKIVRTIDDFQLSEIQDELLIGVSLKENGKSVHFEQKNIVKPGVNGIQYPSSYTAGHEYFQLVGELLKNQQLALGVEYFENNRSIAISYYLSSGEKYSRSLIVLQNDVELYHEIIDEQLNGQALGSFFVLNQKIFFIKNQTQLNAIEF
ncbi:MAG: hypothetical protein ACJA0X_000179 [Cyclobacteriaceae bacterium]